MNGPPEELAPDPLAIPQPAADPAVPEQKMFITSTVQSVVVTQPLLSVTVSVYVVVAVGHTVILGSVLPFDQEYVYGGNPPDALPLIVAQEY